jgi:hypothetical protein
MIIKSFFYQLLMINLGLTSLIVCSWLILSFLCLGNAPNKVIPNLEVLSKAVLDCSQLFLSSLNLVLLIYYATKIKYFPSYRTHLNLIILNF